MTKPGPRSPYTPPMANVLVAFQGRIRDHGKEPALMRKSGGHWETLTWELYGQQAQRVARALAASGVQPGDRVGLISATRLEWVVCDMAILANRAITVPVYPSSTAQDSVYILNHARVKLCFVETTKLWEKIKSQRDKLPAGITFVLIDGSDPELTSFQKFLESAPEQGPDMIEEASRSISGDDVATIVYTSGTTGLPKGAVLTHGNLVAEAHGVGTWIGRSTNDITLSFLPLAHIFARMIHITSIVSGYVTAYAVSMDTVIENLAEVKPSFMAGVPRLFEKIYAKVMGQLEAAGGVKGKLGKWALSVGQRVAEARRKGEPVGGVLALELSLADKMVLSKIRARFGGNMQFFVSGGAPLSRDIAAFFEAIGCEILEGYGLTETTAATHLNPRGKARLGSVGIEMPGVETRIAEDGEVCLRGPHIMKGYYEDATATAASFDGDWFLTGDIGEIDADGYLKITDRKKDLLITAAGKNIAPQKIENALKTIPFLSQAMVYGDRKKFLVALLTLNVPETIARLARDGVTVKEGEPLASHPKVRALVQQAVDEKNRELASYETIKSFVLLDQDLTMDSAELTPTMKLRRREVVKRYGAQLEALYGEEAAPVTDAVHA